MGVRHISLFLANILLPAAVILFGCGLFSSEPTGIITPYAYKEKAPPLFDKVVFMVIDALRSDFIYSNRSGFEFAQRSGSAIPFTAHANPPSLTISCIKAMTIGSNPSFLDVALNIADNDDASNLSSEDTWLQAREDWSALVFHFPGMDHIGHTGGPESPYILRKQQEMDFIIREIYTAIESQPHLSSTLFVVAGDHGMNQQGNHGGSSAGEISPGMLLISPDLKSLPSDREAPTAPHGTGFDFYSVIKQPDIVPTLAGLLGFRIPSKSEGVFMPQLLSLWEDPSDRVRLLLENAHQLLNVRGHHVDHPYHISLQRIEDRIVSDPSSTEALSELYQWCYQMQNSLGMAAGSLNFRLLSAGLLSAVSASILCLSVLFNGHLEVKHMVVSTVFAAVYTGAMLSEKYVTQEHNFWYPVSLIWFGYLSYSRDCNCSPFDRALPVLVQFLVLSWTQSGDATDMLPKIFQTFLSRYPLILWIMLSWAYVSTSVRLYGSLGSACGSTIVPKIWATSLGALALLLKFGSASLNTPDLVRFTSPHLLYWLAQVNLNSTAKLVFSILAGTLVYLLTLKGKCKRTKELAGIHHVLAIYIMAQSRPRNIPLFLVFQWQLKWLILAPSTYSVFEIALSTIILSQSSFFTFGGSNTIASVDLTNGYNGVTSYNSIAVVLQTLFANWAGPIWWACAGIRLLEITIHHRASQVLSPKKSDQEDKKRVGKPSSTLMAYLAIQTLFISISLAAIMVACVVLWDSSMIWTALAPKYIFAGLWVVFYHVFVTVGLFGAVGKAVLAN
ncbi:GPI ethanolamine phosphate transferase [Penicillium chrysogenum]|uniref:GPI ethanolamine phosphate transferase 2 n=1 Tax=Penicillium chrysogenum TaxID=5076 RepID=A0A162CN05_PENCH|nr:GPI ethanolamine phosphate transferase [Penicillium chrysogenum]